MKSGIALLMCALLAAIWLMGSDRTPSTEPVSKLAVRAANAPQSAPAPSLPALGTLLPTAPKHSLARSTATPTPSPNQEPAPLPEYDLDQAMAMMQQSAAEGDPRQPQLAPHAADIPPDATEMPDPQLYDGRESKHELAMIAAFAQSLRQLPAMRARIAQAQTDSSRTPAELQEAKEAVEQLEQFRERLERARPELLP